MLSIGNMKVSNFGELWHTSITHDTWTRFVKHPKQQRLVYYYDNIFHDKPKSEELGSFWPKKTYYSKTSEKSHSPWLDNFFVLDYWSDETDPSLSSSPDVENIASNHHEPSE